mgnify:CR=1 FL=1
MINLRTNERMNMNWETVIHDLNDSGGPVKIKMGSPGSAQVTRCRLMDTYDGLNAKTQGNDILLELA